MKVDDDCFFSLDKIKEEINSATAANANSLMIGKPSLDAKPLRHFRKRNPKLRRWLVPMYMYKKQVFPDYMNGPGYVLNRAGVRCILLVKNNLMLFEFSQLLPTTTRLRKTWL